MIKGAAMTCRSAWRTYHSIPSVRTQYWHSTNAGMPPSDIAAPVGHECEFTLDEYSMKLLPIPRLQGTMEEVMYPELSLSHLETT